MAHLPGLALRQCSVAAPYSLDGGGCFGVEVEGVGESKIHGHGSARVECFLVGNVVTEFVVARGLAANGEGVVVVAIGGTRCTGMVVAGYDATSLVHQFHTINIQTLLSTCTIVHPSEVHLHLSRAHTFGQVQMEAAGGHIELIGLCASLDEAVLDFVGIGLPPRRRLPVAVPSSGRGIQRANAFGQIEFHLARCRQCALTVGAAIVAHLIHTIFWNNEVVEVVVLCSTTVAEVVVVGYYIAAHVKQFHADSIQTLGTREVFHLYGHAASVDFICAGETLGVGRRHVDR